MSESLNSTPNLETQIESSNVVGKCCYHGTGFQRAMMYTPVVLLTSAFVAVGMFPNLAEYATPILDLNKPVCTSDQSVSIECMRQMMLKSSICSLNLVAAAEESTIEADSIESSDTDPADATSVANSVGSERGLD